MEDKDKKEGNDLHHPHDKLIRHALKRREVVVNLLEKAIPPKDYTEEKILTIGNTFLVNTFLLLKFGNQKKYVELNYAKFFTFDPQYFQDLAYRELVKVIVKYMLAIKTVEKEKFIELTNKLPEDMKQLVKEDFNYFQWEGIQQEKNDVIKNGFESGLPTKTIAFLVKLTVKEVEQRIKEMKLTKPAKGSAAN